MDLNTYLSLVDFLDELKKLPEVFTIEMLKEIAKNSNYYNAQNNTEVIIDYLNKGDFESANFNLKDMITSYEQSINFFSSFSKQFT